MGMYGTDKGIKLGLGIMEAFKGNPVISALVGMGLGWAIAAGADGSHKAEELKEKISEVLEEKGIKGGRRMSDLMGSTKEYAQEFGEQAGKWAKDFGASAQEQYKKACEGVKEMAEERPVVLAAVSAGIAAAIGFGIWQLLREKE